MVPKVSEAHLEARRGQILDGARRAIARHGYHGATVAKLEEEIGLSRGAIFNYYPDKWSLFLALVRRDRHRFFEVLQKDGLDGLLRQLTEESPEWLGVYFELAHRLRTNPELMEDLKDAAPEEAEQSLALFEAWQRDGDVRDDVSLETIVHFVNVVPPGRDPAFIDAVLDIVRRENIDIVLPQSSFDLLALAEGRERFMATNVLVSPPEAIRTANDKAAAYALLERLGLRAPAWRKVTGGRALAVAAQELGYPERPVCFKPVFSSGSRGFRVLDATVDRAKQLFEERPGNLAMRLNDVVELLPQEGGPDLLVMELATGRERTVDGIARAGQVVLGHAKTRESMRAGLAMYFETLNDHWLLEVAQRIVAELGIEYFFNIQLVR